MSCALHESSTKISLDIGFNDPQAISFDVYSPPPTYPTGIYYLLYTSMLSYN